MTNPPDTKTTAVSIPIDACICEGRVARPRGNCWATTHNLKPARRPGAASPEVRTDPLAPIARRLETLALRIAAGTITPTMATWHLQRAVCDLRILTPNHPTR